jgi:hypothetical protein
MCMYNKYIDVYEYISVYTVQGSVVTTARYMYVDDRRLEQ